MLDYHQEVYTFFCSHTTSVTIFIHLLMVLKEQSKNDEHFGLEFTLEDSEESLTVESLKVLTVSSNMYIAMHAFVYLHACNAYCYRI